MNKILQRTKYFNEKQKEFKDNGWDFSKAIGRANPYNIVRNKTTFENFKKRVSKQRTYNRERESISSEYEKIWTRIRKSGQAKSKKRTTSIKEVLKKMGYSNRSIRKIIDLQNEYNKPTSYLTTKHNVQKLISNKAIDSLINEFEVERNNKPTKVRGAFSRFYDIPRIKDRLNKFEKMVYEDKKSIHHVESVLQDFLNNVIPQRYNDFKEKHGRYITPPEQFYVDLTDELIHMYSKFKD